MKRALNVLGMAVFLVGLLTLPAVAVEPVAQVSGGGASVDWTPLVPNNGLVLTVSGPDGTVVRRQFRAGKNPSLSLFDKTGQRLPDGEYTYELRVVPVVDAELQKALTAAHEAGDEAAIDALRKSGRLPRLQVQSGSFLIADGSAVTAGLQENEGRRGARNRASEKADGIANTFLKDQVIPDDLIVQQSLCVGFDCVNNESFGFDTIRLKENSTRIKFEDTSTGTFPSNDWQLTANDSASGGANKFSIEDITGSKVPFTITAGASTNSIFVDSTGRVGFRTSTPVLDLHVNTSNTPALRLEQNNSGGFTAQTWDVGANEANFFVRDVTGGSKLSLRIRPGAPTSSVDISADGDVGIGTGSPEAKLHIFGGNTSDVIMGIGPNPDGSTVPAESALNIFYGGATTGRASGVFNVRPDTGATAPNPSLRFWVANNERMIIDNEGFIGLGVANPTSPIQHSNGAFLSSTGTWQNASSRDYKQDITKLPADAAMTTLRGLEPVTFAYKIDPSEHHVGFIAEDVPDLVAAPGRKSLSSLDIVAVLTKVVQEQQKMIDDLSAKVAELEKQN